MYEIQNIRLKHYIKHSWEKVTQDDNFTRQRGARGHMYSSNRSRIYSRWKSPPSSPPSSLGVYLKGRCPFQEPSRYRLLPSLGLLRAPHHAFKFTCWAGSHCTHASPTGICQKPSHQLCPDLLYCRHCRAETLNVHKAYLYRCVSTLFISRSILYFCIRATDHRSMRFNLSDPKLVPLGKMTGICWSKITILTFSRWLTII